jgi:DNA-binding CsgD family transcriptional regulator
MTRRRALHRQIGEFLTEGAMPDPDAIAYHFQQAGDPRASGWLIRAGVRAEGAYAWNSAARSYVAAHAMLESDPKTAQARGWLLFQVGYLLRYTDTGHAQAHLEEAERVASAIGDPVLAAHSRFFHGLLRCFRSELGEGVAEMGHAVGAADRISFQDQERARQAIASLFPEEIFTHPRVTSGGLLIKIGVLPDVNALTHTYILWLAIAGRLREAVTLGEDLVASVVAATDSELLIQDFCRDAYHGLALASETLGRPEDARRWWAQAIAAYGSIGHHALVGAVNRGLLVHVLTYRTERVTERRRVARAAVAAAERAGGAWGYPARTNALPLDLLEGRWDGARDVTLPVLDQANANAPPTAWTIRLPVFSVLGREWSEPRFIDVVWADIHAILRDGLATEPGDREYFLSTTAQRLAAELSLDAGDLHQARAWLEMHDRWLKWSGAVLGRTDAELLWARYHRIAGDLNVARRHAGRALNHASNPRQPLALIAAHRVLGTLDSDEGHHEDALDHLELSLELAGACAAPVEQAQTMLALSELATKSGDSDKAMSMLREVRRICEPLNTKRTLERAAQIERQLRSRVARYPAGLSGREVEVLELVAEGMTNPEVGQTLFISPRTVSQHLRSIYNKLDVGSRTAAVARWAELSRE